MKKMDQPIRFRPLAASYLSAAAALLPLVALVLCQLFLSSREADPANNGADQGAVLFLAILPLAYGILVVIFYYVGKTILLLGFRHWIPFLLITNGIGLAFFTLIGFFGAHVPDLFTASVVLFGLVILTTLPGTICWWFIAIGRQQTIKEV
jgi:hypothetical protein